MTREELIEIIYNSAEVSACPDYNCTGYRENKRFTCKECSEELLNEYEKEIYNKGYKDGVARQRLNCDDCFYKLSLEEDKNIREILEATRVLETVCEECHDCSICPLELNCSTMFNVIPRRWEKYTVIKDIHKEHIMNRFTKVE